MKSNKTKLIYKGDQINTFLAYKGGRVEGINLGDEIEVPADIAKELVEQGNYEFANKSKQTKKEDEKDGTV